MEAAPEAPAPTSVKRERLRADQLPPKWERKAFKDPERAAQQISAQERPARTPCEAAWRVPSYRDAVARWLEAGTIAGLRLSLRVMMPEKVVRDAVFERRNIIVHGQRFVAAVDGQNPATIFASRRKPA